MGFRWGLALLLVVALEASAEGPASADETPFRAGAWRLGLSVGWAHGMDLGNDAARDIDAVAALPTVAVGLTDPLGAEGAWYRGNVELAGEGHFLIKVDPGDGEAAGGAALLRYNFLAHDRLVPFLEVGGGMIHRPRRRS